MVLWLIDGLLIDWLIDWLICVNSVLAVLYNGGTLRAFFSILNERNQLFSENNY